MQEVTKLKSAGRTANYFTEKNRLGQYYVHEDEQKGIFIGGGRRFLHLKEEVDRTSFQNLLNGFSPDGNVPLVQNAGHKDRPIAWDITLSAPKAVSVLWALSGPRERAIILQAHKRAVEETFKRIEQECGFSRRGQRGELLERVDLLAAEFTHFTSRAFDMAIHSHIVLFNIGFRADGTTGALYTNKIFEMKKEHGTFYREVLAEGLVQGLGVEIEPERVGFHIKGVPKELCREFSKRRVAIEMEMEQKGEPGAIAAREAALSTRPKKQHASLESLTQHWKEVAQRHGFGPDEVNALLNTHQQRLVNTEHDRTQMANTTNDSDKPALTNPQTVQTAPKDTVKTSSDVQSLGKEPGKSIGNSPMPENAQTKPANERIKPDESRQSRQQLRKAPGSREQRGNREKARNRESEAKFQAGKNIPQTGKSKKGWIRIERKLVFPNAPEWSPVKHLTAPVVAIGNRRQFRRWGKIVWSKDLKVFRHTLVQLRVQQKALFPKAPTWNPLHKAQVPAIRILGPSQLREARTLKAYYKRLEERLSHSH